MKTTRRKKVQYLGRDFLYWEVKADDKRDGKRVVLRHNLREDYVDLTVLEGNYLGKGFMPYFVSRILAPIDYDAVNRYAKTLAGNYFGQPEEG